MCIFFFFKNGAAAEVIKERQANENEWDYEAIATTMNYPKLCYKIYQRAITNGAPWSPKGFQISYLRSQCLFDIAKNLNDPALCTDDIKPYSTFSFDGSRITKAECLLKVNETISEHSHPVTNGSFRHPKEVLQSMGYTKEMIPKDIIENEQGVEFGYWYDYFLQIRGTKEFQTKLDALPNFTQ